MAAESLYRLYRDMVRIRRVEEVIAELYPQQQMRCPVHLCVGQEGTPVGVCAELGAGDPVFSTHRSHGHYLAKGGSLVALLAELYGREAGCSGGKGGSMHLVDLDCGFLGAAPICATAALAVGAAFGIQLKGREQVAVAFFGDAAPEEGVFYEAANFAVVHHVPVLLVCENNGLSTVSPLSVPQPAGRSLCDVAHGIGMTARAGDGNDVLEVRQLAREAVRELRSGRGPVFLEFQTYRILEHCGPGNDLHMGFRTSTEIEQWQARCPIRRLQAHLVESGDWDAGEMDALHRQIEAEISAAVKTAQDAPFPPPQQLMQDEYAP